MFRLGDGYPIFRVASGKWAGHAAGMWFSKVKSTRVSPHEELLRKVPLFAGLKRSEMQALEEILHDRSYLAGEIVFEEGEQGMGMYLVVEGKVAIRRADGYVLAELGPGEFFGELALLDEDVRSATAVALESCRLLGFFKTELKEIMRTRGCMAAKINYQMAVLLALRLRRANAEMPGPGKQ